MGRQAELAELARVFNTSALSNRNLIINGAMQVAQRGTSSAAEGYQTVDRFRWNTSLTTELAITQSQDTDAPDGFACSYKLAVTTPETSVDTTEWLRIVHPMEGQNLQHLSFGTSAAKQTTLSFWVKSNVTGDYAVLFFSNDNPTDRSQTLTYTINSADTWEYKTITFDGDTVNSITNDNLGRIVLYFTLSAGPNRKNVDGTSWGAYENGKAAYGQTADVAGTTGGYFQFTGVQLEVGDTATPFENRSYGQELALCQRYYWKNDTSTGYYGSVYGTGGNSMLVIDLPVTMRVTPTTGYDALGGGGSVSADYSQPNRWCLYISDPSVSVTRPTADAEL